MNLALFDDPAVLAHVAVALRVYRDTARREHRTYPDGLTEIEEFCAGRLRKVQGGATLAKAVMDAHDAAMTPTLLDTLPTAAGALAVSVATVKRLIDANELPAVKVGSRTLVRRCDLEHYVDNLHEVTR